MTKETKVEIKGFHDGLAEEDMWPVFKMLRKAQKLLAQESRWTQGATARNLYYEPCSPTSVLARFWDVTGAISCVKLDTPLGRKKRKKIRKLARVFLCYGAGVCQYKLGHGISSALRAWNDAPDRNFKDVLKAFEEAIACADKKYWRD